MKNDIETTLHVDQLVRTFYDKIRQDQLLMPIFNLAIEPQQWNNHMKTLVGFWCNVLWANGEYIGDPRTAHIEVDKTFNGKIGEVHFGHWLNIWHCTVDQLFHGKNAEKVKNTARRMSTGLYLAIWQSREENK